MGGFFPISSNVYPTEDEIDSLERLGRYILAANDFKLACYFVFPCRSSLSSDVNKWVSWDINRQIVGFTYYHPENNTKISVFCHDKALY